MDHTTTGDTGGPAGFGEVPCADATGRPRHTRVQNDDAGRVVVIIPPGGSGTFDREQARALSRALLEFAALGDAHARGRHLAPVPSGA
ncbi:hypothetical protein SAMN05421837_107395 [Amycolatopsis pretoriensis]|uniref:Uncharacterized protein n=1 Tax=Amycolatopsis pretoriensis TaxID=218821 RepID=A0A1H5R7T4_9PSEU|nr:hypothetical protein SAMN05421837_107395 [Amycolatopsis pretoriensis]